MVIDFAGVFLIFNIMEYFSLMKWFNFLIDNLKKWWGDRSSSHQLPGVLLVTRQGLRLPVTLVSSGLYAFSLLARKVKSLLHFRIAGLRVSDATLSRREQGASKRRAGLAIARGIGWAMILTGLSGAAYGYGLQADDGSDHYACRDRDRVISFNNVPSESDLDCLYNRDPDNLVYLPNNYPESSEYIQGNDDIQFYMDIQGGFWQTTLYFSHWEGEFVVRDGSGYCWVLERTADHSYIYLLREYLDGDSFALNNVYCVNNASTFHITSNPSVSIEENSTATVLDITVPPLAVGAEYLISEDADAAAFSIGLTSGTLSFVSPPDFETKNSYTFDVSATFGSLTTTQSITVTVTDVAEPPLITNPSPGSTLTGDTETITWIASAGMTGVIIDAGSSAYSNDYHSSGTLDPTVTNEVIMNLPTDGSPVYVTIWYKFPDIAWQRVLHEFTALDDGSTGGSSTSATIISHTSGDTLTSSEQTFIWSDVGADEYLLQIGSAQGSSSILSTGYITSTERFVSNLPTGGSQIFVSLWTIHDGQWNPSYSSYWAVNIQGSAPTITSLNTGDTLTSSEQTFTWSDVGASNYWLQIGSSVDRNDIYDSGMLTTNTEQLVSNLPTDGSPIYVRIWYRNNGQWHDIKDSYTAVNIPGSGEPTPPTITSLNTGDTLTSAEQTFTWSDVGASSYWLQIGSDIGRSNIYDSGVLTSTEQSVSDLPTDGSTIYVRIWYQNNGQWDYIQDSYMAMNIPGSGEPTPPTMTSLNTGDTLTSSEQTFIWSDVGVSDYWLQIGSGVGRSDYHDSGILTTVEQSVSDLPTDGSPIYVRVWYKHDGQWDYIDENYLALNTMITIPSGGTSCNAVAGVMSGWKSAYCDATFTYLGEAYRPVLWTRLYFGDGIEYVIGSMQGPSTTFEPMPGDTRLGNSNGSSKTVEAGACTSTYPTDPTNGSLFVAQSVFCFYFLTDTHLITLQATTGEDTYAVLSNVMGAYYPR